MTLVISFVHPDFIIQVSDRRITLISSEGKRSVRDDDTNKVIVVDARAMVSFTGVAEIDGRTDLWLANRLNGVPLDLGVAFDVIRDDLTEVFKARRYRGIPHTVTACGYSVQNGVVVPFHSMITNLHDGSATTRSVHENFVTVTELAPPGRSGVFVFPSWLSPKEVAALTRIIERVLKRAPFVHNIGNLLVRQVRAVAAREMAVGADLMVAVLPRWDPSAAEYGVFMGPISDEGITVHHLPADSARAEREFPLVVMDGGIVEGTMTSLS